MKNIAAVVLTALTLTCAPAFAQPAKVDPDTTKAVHALFSAMDYGDMVKKSIAEMLKSMPTWILNQATAEINANPKFNDEQKKAAIEGVTKNMPAIMVLTQTAFNDPTLIDDMLTETVPLYARLFTVAEIEQMAAFHRSPLGAKMLALTPKILSEGMMIGQRVMMPRFQKVMEQAAKGK